MTKSEMIDLMISSSKENCSQVADLQYYKGEGPFLFVFDEKDGQPKFFFFSFADADEFLDQPEDLPTALQIPEFPFTLAEALNLDHLEGSKQFYQLTYYKIVPDEPLCRAALKELWQSDPQIASLISLLGADGVLIPAAIYCGEQGLLS